MMRRFGPAGYALLLVVLFLTLVLPSIVMADGQSETTLSPEPTTLGQITEKTNPTFYFMLTGAGIIGVGAMLIFIRYR